MCVVSSRLGGLGGLALALWAGPSGGGGGVTEAQFAVLQAALQALVTVRSVCLVLTFFLGLLAGLEMGKPS